MDSEGITDQPVHAFQQMNNSQVLTGQEMSSPYLEVVSMESSDRCKSTSSEDENTLMSSTRSFEKDKTSQHRNYLTLNLNKSGPSSAYYIANKNEGKDHKHKVASSN